MPCSFCACVPNSAPPAAGALAVRHIQAAQQSLHSSAVKETWAPDSIEPLTASLAVPQYRRTFIQGCACSTGFAGGGCCPSGAAGIALQAGCRAHQTLGLFTGVAGALGLYGGARVVANSLDARAQIGRVRQNLAPRLEHLTLLQAQAAAAGVPCIRLGQQVRALRQWAQALEVSAAEQTFNLWVPGVLQLLAAGGAVYMALGHAGVLLLGPVVGASVGLCAPALFAAYGVLLACKSWRALRGMPAERRAAGLGAAMDNAPADRTFAAQNTQYRRARRTALQRTALGWGLVGANGIATTLAAAGVWATGPGASVLIGLSLGAAAFAMWQNSQTRFVPHLPVSPHVAPPAVGEPAQRQASVLALSAQDAAVKQAVAQLHDDLLWPQKTAHRIERLLRPQCGPNANRVLADFVGAQARGPDKARAGRHTRILLQAATTWCTEEIALEHGRLAEAETNLTADVAAMDALLRPNCPRKAARMQQILAAAGPLAHTYHETSQYLRDDAQSLEAAQLRLQTLRHCLVQLQALHNEPMQALTAGDIGRPSPAQRWLQLRLHLLLISGTLGDALDAELIGANRQLFSQLTHTGALPITNVYVLPAQLAALLPSIAPQIDASFVHAFFNPRRIEAEIDYLFELEATHSAAPQAPATAPLCTAQSCCS